MRSYKAINLVLVGYLLIATLFTNCVGLKAVTDYSSNSVVAIKKLDDIPYDFSRGCQERCELNAIDSFKIIRTIKCPCTPYKRADSVTRSIYRSAIAYFETLETLSSNKVAEYEITPLQRSLKGLDGGPVQMSDHEVDAYSKLLEVLLEVSTSRAQQRKCKDMIEHANDPIQQLLAKLASIENTNLRELLEFKKERLFAYYRDLGKSKLSDYERQQSTAAYYAAIKEVDHLEQQLKIYSESLVHIAKGHQLLYDNRNKLSGKELVKTINTLTKDVQDLITKFDKT